MGAPLVKLRVATGSKTTSFFGSASRSALRGARLERLHGVVDADGLVHDLVADDRRIAAEARGDVRRASRGRRSCSPSASSQKLSKAASAAAERVAVGARHGPAGEHRRRRHDRPQGRAVLAQLLGPAVLVQIEEHVDAGGAAPVDDAGDAVEVGLVELAARRLDGAPVDGQAHQVEAAGAHVDRIGRVERRQRLARRAAVREGDVEDAGDVDVDAAVDLDAPFGVAQVVAVRVDRREASGRTCRAAADEGDERAHEPVACAHRSALDPESARQVS